MTYEKSKLAHHHCSPSPLRCRSSSLDDVLNDEIMDFKTRRYAPISRSPSPSSQFKTLLPSEKIDFNRFQQSIESLPDQCRRFMKSLKEARQTIQNVIMKQDDYKDF